MAFVTTLHLQTSADATLSCKPGRPVTRGDHDKAALVKEFLADIG